MTNDAASATNDASRPNSAENPPPRAAPMASMAPQVEPKSALACFSSSGSSDQVRDGGLRGRHHERAERPRWSPGRGTPATPGPGLRRAGETAATTWTIDASTMIRRRSKRSAAAPATGDTRKAGSVWATKTSATSRLESGEVLHQADQRDVAEPVAREGHDLGDEQRPEIPVAPQHRSASAASAIAVGQRRAWSSSTTASAAVTRSPVGRWRYSFGPCALLPGPSDAGDDELRLGELLAEHAHERDGAALAEGSGGRAEGTLATHGPGRPSSHGANVGAFQPGPGFAAGEGARGRRRAGSAVSAPAIDGQGARRRRSVGGSRNESCSAGATGRSTLPALVVGGSPSAPMIDSVGPPRVVQDLLDGVVRHRPGAGDERERGGVRSAWPPRSPRPGAGGRPGWRRAARRRRISPVAASSTRSSSWRAMRNVLGTTPLAAPEWTPFVEDVDRERAAGQAAQRGRDPQPLVVGAARVEAEHERRRADAIGQGLEVGGQVGRAALLAGLDRAPRSGRGRHRRAGRPRWRPGRRTRRSRRRRRPGRRGGRPRSRASTGPRPSRQPSISGCLSRWP